MIYEYRAKQCPDRCERIVVCSAAEAPTHTVKLAYEEGRILCNHDHPFRRVFSSRVVSRYKTVHAPDTRNEREFTSSRQYASFLRSESHKIEDRTGIPTRLEPVDLYDPAVMPDFDPTDA